jgi:hypothetical protein
MPRYLDTNLVPLRIQPSAAIRSQHIPLTLDPMPHNLPMLATHPMASAHLCHAFHTILEIY